MIAPTKLVIFDLDGTIADTIPALTKLAEKVISETYNVNRSLSKTLYRQTLGHPFSFQLEMMFPGDRKNKRASLCYEKLKAKIYLDQLPFPDSFDILDYLKNSGSLSAICSSTTLSAVKKYLTLYSLRFDLVGGYKEHKPKKVQIMSFLQQIKSVQKILFVGDSEEDRNIANEIPIPFVKVDRSNHSHLSITNLLEITKLL